MRIFFGYYIFCTDIGMAIEYAMFADYIYNFIYYLLSYFIEGRMYNLNMCNCFKNNCLCKPFDMRC